MMNKSLKTHSKSEQLQKCTLGDMMCSNDDQNNKQSNKIFVWQHVCPHSWTRIATGREKKIVYVMAPTIIIIYELSARYKQHCMVRLNHILMLLCILRGVKIISRNWITYLPQLSKNSTTIGGESPFFHCTANIYT